MTTPSGGEVVLVQPDWAPPLFPGATLSRLNGAGLKSVARRATDLSWNFFAEGWAWRRCRGMWA